MIRPSILNSQIMQTELLLHLPEQLLARLMQPNPDESVGLFEHCADRANLYIFNAPAIGISRAVDDCTYDWVSVLR